MTKILVCFAPEQYGMVHISRDEAESSDYDAKIARLKTESLFGIEPDIRSISWNNTGKNVAVSYELEAPRSVITLSLGQAIKVITRHKENLKQDLPDTSYTLDDEGRTTRIPGPLFSAETVRLMAQDSLNKLVQAENKVLELEAQIERTKIEVLNPVTNEHNTIEYLGYGGHPILVEAKDVDQELMQLAVRVQRMTSLSMNAHDVVKDVAKIMAVQIKQPQDYYVYGRDTAKHLLYQQLVMSLDNLQDWSGQLTALDIELFHEVQMRMAEYEDTSTLRKELPKVLQRKCSQRMYRLIFTYRDFGGRIHTLDTVQMTDAQREVLNALSVRTEKLIIFNDRDLPVTQATVKNFDYKFGFDTEKFKSNNSYQTVDGVRIRMTDAYTKLFNFTPCTKDLNEIWRYVAAWPNEHIKINSDLEDTLLSRLQK